MRTQQAPGGAFLALSFAFIALGISGNRTFLFVGIAFLAIGVGMLRRGRR